jgi:hypothetical protein
MAHWMNIWSKLSLEGSDRVNWYPMIWSRGWNDKVMTYTPVDAIVISVVPVGLLRDEYAQLSRMWIVQMTGIQGWKDISATGLPDLTFGASRSCLGMCQGEYAAQDQGQYCTKGFRVYGPMPKG